jgi:tetratricopeptide (TPR) repeat protein
MFSSRNIHFAILGIILGGASGYIFAFYQAQNSIQRAPAAAAATAPPQDHPDVSNEQMVAMFNEALQKNPNDPELMRRYARFLSDTGKFQESIEWFQKLVALNPDNPNAHADIATAYWNMGQKDKALAELEAAAKIDPKNISLARNLFLVQLRMGQTTAAAESLKRIEEVDPKLAGLSELKQQLEEARGQTPK